MYHSRVRIKITWEIKHGFIHLLQGLWYPLPLSDHSWQIIPAATLLSVPVEDADKVWSEQITDRLMQWLQNQMSTGGVRSGDISLIENHVVGALTTTSFWAEVYGEYTLLPQGGFYELLGEVELP